MWTPALRAIARIRLTPVRIRTIWSRTLKCDCMVHCSPIADAQADSL